jgi:hypothetical protein
MARKNQRKQSWLRKLALVVALPVAVWIVAFLLWFYWFDLKNFITGGSGIVAGPKGPGRTGADLRPERAPAKPPPQEKIFEEDRQKLEDILKRRS